MTMLDFRYHAAFKKDMRQAAFQGRDVMKIFAPLFCLVTCSPLPKQYRDHALKGKWEGHHELHIEDDWVIIYMMDNKGILLERAGSHRELFGE
jgi:mRNA interferase YafQ